MDWIEEHGSGQGKLHQKKAYSQLTTLLALSAERIQALCYTAPLAWQSQSRQSMVIDVHPIKFRKNPIFAVDMISVTFPLGLAGPPLLVSPGLAGPIEFQASRCCPQQMMCITLFSE